MSRRQQGASPSAALAAVALALLLAGGIARLFVLQVRRSDSFPPYSSYRSDPLGAQALHDSLGRCPGRQAERHFRPVEEIEDPASVVLYRLGANAPGWFNWLAGEAGSRTHTFVRGGGRLVVAFLPGSLPAQLSVPAEEAAPEDPPAPDADNGGEEPALSPAAATASGPSFPLLWGVRLAQADGDAAGEARLDTAHAGLGLPDAMTCRSPLYFADLDPAWRTVYRFEGRPVVIERDIGRGTAVFSVLTYVFSNEGLREERHPAFLAWCAGRAPRQVFDEWHHGIVSQPGLAALAGRPLRGLLAGLFLLALLFVWRNAFGLVPPDPAFDAPRPEESEGRDARAGLVHLLRRALREADLPAACLAEFEKDARLLSLPADRLADMRRMLAEESETRRGARDPAGLYNRLALLLKRRRSHPSPRRNP